MAISPKGPSSDAIMAADKMKPLLALSKKEPVQAAIGLTSDGDGLLLLDKKAKPKKVLSMLRAAAAKAKLQLNSSSLRFGRAEVDTEYDAGMVRLFINKDAPGNMRIKLIEVVKRIPYQKVEINVDPSLEDEPEDEAEAHEAAAEAPATAPPPPPPPAPPPQATPAPDAATLTAQLRTLIGQVPAAAGDDTARKANFAKLAAAAGAQLKAANLPAAAEAIAHFRTALAVPATSAPDNAANIAAAAAGGTAGAVAYGKARLIWLSTRRKIAGDIEMVLEAIRADYADEGLDNEIGAEFQSRVAPIMAALDESLADMLDDAMNQTDAAKRADMVAQARAIVARYQAYLASEPLIGLLDENPYVPIAIGTTLANTLTALSAAIR